MFEFRNQLHLLIFIYIIISVLIWKLKPSLMFKDGVMKEFGIGQNKTVFAYPIVIIFFAILLFFLFEIMMLYKTNLM